MDFQRLAGPIRLPAAALLAAGLLAGPGAAGATPRFVVRPLSDDAVTEREPRVSGERAVWQRGAGAGAEVYYYEFVTGERVVPLTQNGVEDASPAIAGARVVWQQDDGNDYELVEWDGVNVTYLTNDTYNQVLPAISGATTAWLGFVPPSLTDAEIFLRPNSPSEQLTGNSLDDLDLVNDTGSLAWRRHDGNDWDIWFFDAAVPGQFEITTDSVDQSAPRLSSRRIVWSQSDGDGEIWRYDPEAVIPTLQLTNNGFDDTDPDISGNEMVWVRDDGGGDLEIIRQTEGGTPQPLTNNAWDDHSPRISGQSVVWVADQPGDSEIWVSVAWLNGGAPTRLIDNALHDRNPRIDGDYIVWEACTNPGQPSEECDIWMAPEPAAGAIGAAAGLALAALAAGRRVRDRG
jgi:serralysin